jgi:hypothetical protein
MVYLILALLVESPIVGARITEDGGTLIRQYASDVLTRYRLPSAQDLVDHWAEHAREHGGPPVFVKGDFNGDGREDLAFLLPPRGAVPPRQVGFGLFCLLSASSGSFRLVTVEEDRYSYTWIHGIGAQPPGTYTTYCGASRLDPPPECKGQPAEVTVKHQIIHLYAVEKADVFYAWDQRAKTFRRFQISD